MVGEIVGPSHPIIAIGLSHNFHLATCRVIGKIDLLALKLYRAISASSATISYIELNAHVSKYVRIPTICNLSKVSKSITGKFNRIAKIVY